MDDYNPKGMPSKNAIKISGRVQYGTIVIFGPVVFRSASPRGLLATERDHTFKPVTWDNPTVDVPLGRDSFAVLRERDLDWKIEALHQGGLDLQRQLLPVKKRSPKRRRKTK